MNAILKHVRLLPLVLIAGTALLALKGTGIVREAEAQEQTAQAQATSDDVASPKDFANDDGATASAAEVDVLTSLSKRRSELDGRAQDLDLRENELAATEQRVDDKISQLKQLQAQMTQLLGQRDAEQEKQVLSLVKTYSAMKAKDAARIFNSLSDDVLIPVAQEMKSDALAPILANMNADAAQKLTVKLANRLKLPDTAALTTPAMIPPVDPALTPPTAQPAGAPPPAATTPQTQASTTPPAAPQTPAPQTTSPQTAPPQKPAPKGA